jgi:hypothetical protein
MAPSKPKSKAKPKPKPKVQWIWAKTLTPEAKADIAAKCERFIEEVLKPKFLPEIKPTQWNYPVGISGKWRGSKYSFIVRWRSGFPQNAGEEFENGFVRLDHSPGGAEFQFDVMWHRHTGQWWPVYHAVTLEEALHAIETDVVLRPPV